MIPGNEDVWLLIMITVVDASG
uniref:Uncharacterized protein n=1 Tax=Anguilla anguilla TaxID=7936 RepID=A0A0E9TL74_ANGAN